MSNLVGPPPPPPQTGFLLTQLIRLQIVAGAARFELKLHHFNNPSGKEADGDCCDSFLGTNCGGLFDSDCDPALLICMEDPGATWYLG